MDMSGHDILSICFLVRPLHHPNYGGESRIMMDANAELEGLRALDPHVITTIHNRYYSEIYRFARYRLGDETTADDVASEVFVRLLEATHGGRAPQTNVRGWLIGTASNLVNDHFRKVYSRPQDVLPEDDTQGQLVDIMSDPHDHINAKEQQQRIRLAMNGLTEDQKQVITFRFGNGYNLEETAILMGKKANAIKALQFRALAALRRALGDSVYE